jgi:hypothetical protein
MVIRTLLCVALLAGCAASEQPEPAEPVVSSSVADPVVDQDVVDAAAAQVQRYLDVWAERGLVAAGRFVVPEQRAARTDGTFPVLGAGEVTSYDVQRWNGPEDFVLQVELDLELDANRYAWNQGSNTRFVTVTRTEGGRSLLSFASSP